MLPTKQTDSRRKLLLWGAAFLSSLTILKLIPGKKKKENRSTNETVKMLSQDGKLVAIDKRLLASSIKRVNNEELRQWIKK